MQRRCFIDVSHNAEICPSHAKHLSRGRVVCPICPNSARCWVFLTLRCRRIVCQHWPTVSQIWPEFGYFWPNSVGGRHELAIGPLWQQVLEFGKIGEAFALVAYFAARPKSDDPGDSSSLSMLRHFLGCAGFTNSQRISPATRFRPSFLRGRRRQPNVPYSSARASPATRLLTDVWPISAAHA